MTSPATAVSPTPFSEVTRLTPGTSGRFIGTLSPHWTIGGKPNGGYLLAMLGRAAAAVSVHDHVIAASAHYLLPPEPGPVTIEAEVLRQGRTASQVRARMAQEGRPCVEALVTTAGIEEHGAPYWDAGLPAMSSVAYEDCARLVPRTPDGTPVAIMEQVEVRLEPDTSGFLAGAASGRGELRGWLALPADEPFDCFSLVYAVDGFPPATFDVEYAGWVPTLELTVYVRAVPVPGPVRVLQRAQLVESRRVDEVCFVWDSADRLVAQASQLAGIRLG